MSKWLPRKTVGDHLATLRSARTGRRLPDLAAFFGLPLLAAFLPAVHELWPHGLFRSEFRIHNPEALLDGMAILTGALFALTIYVFLLGLRVSDDSRLNDDDSRLPELADELYANTNYASLVAILNVGLLLASSASGAADNGLTAWWAAVCMFLLLHLALTMLMVLKRTQAIYQEFRAWKVRYESKGISNDYV